MLLLLRVAAELQRRHDGRRRKQRETAGRTRLTCPLDVVHTLLDEEGDGPVGGHQVLQGHAEVVALPGSPGGGVQRFEGLGWFLRDRRAVRQEDRTEADRSEGWGGMCCHANSCSGRANRAGSERTPSTLSLVLSRTAVHFSHQFPSFFKAL